MSKTDIVLKILGRAIYYGVMLGGVWLAMQELSGYTMLGLLIVFSSLDLKAIYEIDRRFNKLEEK